MSDIFSGLGNLGGLMKGLSNFMPQDDPKTQLFKLQSEVSDLKKQETELFTEIGKKAVEKYGLESFGETANRMNLVRANLAAAEQKLAEAQGIAKEKEAAEKAALAGRTCSQCGCENPEGTKFCQDCGSKLGIANLCASCGAENPANVRFCQQCGGKMQKEEAAVCQNCGLSNPPGTRFCGDCGTRLEG